MLWSASSIQYWGKKLMISCLRGVAQLIHTRAEEGGLGTAEGKQKKMKESKDSVQRAIKIAENASRNHAHMILDMRGPCARRGTILVPHPRILKSFGFKQAEFPISG
jgi:hypothetical protein